MKPSQPLAPVQLPPGYQLRDWKEDDVGLVAELDARIFGVDAWSHQLFAAEFQSSQTTNTHHYRVLTYNHHIVGFAGLLYGPPYADITTIGVDPHHRGKHLGTALLYWLINTANQLGAQDMLLEVRASNTAAQQLYASNGFEHIHTRPRYYPGGEDAWILRKTLREPGPSTASTLSQKE